MSMDIDWGSIGSGVLSGAGAGATIGNLFGPVGAGIGAGAGALIGGISGYFDSSYATEQQLDAEERASTEWTRQQDALNAEYDRRVADERAYNDPSAQAARLKAAGINPLSSMTNGGAVASNTAGNTGSPSAQVPFKSAMSDIIAVQQLRNSTALTESQIALNMANANKVDKETGKLTLEIALAEWDVKLKEQLYNFNEENYPILLQAGQQKLTNSIQEYNNLVAKENYDKAAADELRQRILVEQQEVLLLAAQKLAVDKDIEISDSKLAQMAQDLETGKFNQEYVKWLAKNEEWLAKTQEWKAKITKKEFQDLWATGYMRDKTKAEKERLEELVLKLQNENEQFSSIWNTNDTSFVGDMFRYLLYLCTNLI